MATTIPAAFDRLRSNLEITSLQQATVSTRQQRVRDAVARRVTVIDSFLTGSYRRHTMISPLSDADVDVFIVLDPSYYRVDGYGGLLDRVLAALRETYPDSKMSRNGQAVTVTFSDFMVDVVPGFYRQGGGYLIPSSNEARWISTNPKVHESYMSSANASHGGGLVPIIKMIKGWNRLLNRPIRSFYLELLVEQILRTVTISNDWSGCRFVWDKGREAIRYKVLDPAQLGTEQVAGLNAGTSLATAVACFSGAYNVALQAEQFASSGQITNAISAWRSLFGDYFPAYG